ncbi:unnamed protein product [Lactuca virosa]|uniref:Uncharacterized protein n=1 Tax=Lactuca virosa TaxID=75947 RepID=A0AAU9MD61_9ASTR|nr:unnamed protein product [Lactuca virosa]
MYTNWHQVSREMGLGNLMTNVHGSKALRDTSAISVSGRPFYLQSRFCSHHSRFEHNSIFNFLGVPAALEFIDHQAPFLYWLGRRFTTPHRKGIPVIDHILRWLHMLRGGMEETAGNDLHISVHARYRWVANLQTRCVDVEKEDA